MSKRLGYTWYPHQWKSSIRVFKLTLAERGLYRELIDLAYEEDNKILLDIETWSRQFGCSQEELNVMLSKLVQLKDKDGVPLVELKGEILSVPSCEPRLMLIRGGKKGGETSAKGRGKRREKGKKGDTNNEENKPTVKPSVKPSPKPTVKPSPKPKANQIEKEIEKEIEIEKENEYGDKSPTHTPEENELFLKFTDWIKRKTPRVCKMKEQLTIKEFLKLKEKYDSKTLSDVLIAMQNRADLLKKYISVYLTINNWAKNQNTSNTFTEHEQPIQKRIRQSESKHLRNGEATSPEHGS